MYDKSKCGDELRRKCAVFMGLWHPYKQATILIWRRFATSIIAPLFHHLYPGSSFFTKPKTLTQATTLLTCMRLAYESVKDDIHETLLDYNLDQGHRALAQNLVDVCEFFIPVVISSTYLTKFIHCKHSSLPRCVTYAGSHTYQAFV